MQINIAWYFIRRGDFVCDIQHSNVYAAHIQIIETKEVDGTNTSIHFSIEAKGLYLVRVATSTGISVKKVFFQ